MTVAAVIIARAGSRRLPGKNMLDFHGRPLVAHKAWQLQQVKGIDLIYCGSDSDEILRAAAAEGAIPVKRAPEFCDEVSRPWNDVIADMASRVEADTIVWAHCTNPCIRPATYEQALWVYEKGLERGGDSVISVCTVRSHLWMRGAPLNYDPWNGAHPFAADLEPVSWQNGGIFIYDRKNMIQRRYVYGVRPLMYPLEQDEATDIDTAADFVRAVGIYIDQERTAA